MAGVWVKYIEATGADATLLEAYRELRLTLQRLGFSERDLQSPPIYTSEMMRLGERVKRERDRLINELSGFFGNIDDRDILDYILKKASRIDQEIPMSDIDYAQKN